MPCLFALTVLEFTRHFALSCSLFSCVSSKENRIDMGYSEVYCHICGISFNVGRVRRPDEPRTAAWSGQSSLPGVSFIEDDDWRGRDCLGSGCLIANRQPQETPEKQQDGITEGDGEDSGSEYVVDEDMDDETEPFEFHTPPESIADEIDIDNMDLDMGSDITETDDGEDSPDTIYQDFVLSLSPISHTPSPPQEEMLPPLKMVRGSPFDGVSSDWLEHIAGPDCSQTAGYSGHSITAEEMRGCHTAQALVPKPSWWHPEADDEEFEATAYFFLSGLTDYMPSRDYSDPTVIPSRHGCSSPRTDNSFFDESTAKEMAMPFHPTCLEVFKRASLWGTGDVKMQDLMDWYRLEANFSQFDAFPRDEAAKRGREQMWRHNKGDEFLAANPCFMPNLGPILKSATVTESEDLDYHRAAFELQDSHSALRPNPSDAFACLPPELRYQLLSYLDPKDVGNLRLVSRAFRQLPQSFFHQLLLRHAPWLWEAWSRLPYSFWATTSAWNLRQEDNKWQEEKDDFDRVIYTLVDEGGNEAALEAVRATIDARILEMKRARQSVEAPLLPKTSTDWRQFASDIAARWGDLKGLRNRARIWKDCEEILDRIERHRADGRMGNGIVVDPSATYLAYRETSRKKNQAWHNYVNAGKPGNGEYKWEEWVDRIS